MGSGHSNNKDEESIIDVLLSAFTKNAKEMNALLGFPGVLLLFAVLALALPAIPGYEMSIGLLFISGVSIVASSVTYFALWSYSAKQAAAQTTILNEFIKTFLNKYLADKEKVEAEHIDWAINNILHRLTKKPEIQQ